MQTVDFKKLFNVIVIKQQIATRKSHTHAAYYMSRTVCSSECFKPVSKWGYILCRLRIGRVRGTHILLFVVVLLLIAVVACFFFFLHRYFASCIQIKCVSTHMENCELSNTDSFSLSLGTDDFFA